MISDDSTDPYNQMKSFFCYFSFDHDKVRFW
jgi:hypothetical protein